MKKLILIRGVSGSGKSTLAKLLTSDYRIFEADQYFYDENDNYNFEASKLDFAHKWCQLCVESAMEIDEHFLNSVIVVSNTSTTEEEMKPYIDLANKYNYQVTSLIVENRHGNSSIHNVPQETLDKQRKRLLNNIKL